MYQGNYDSRDKKTSSRDKCTARFRWRKEFVLLVSVFVMIAGVVGGTIAYLTSQSGAITNTFDMATVDCEIQGSGHSTQSKISVILMPISAPQFLSFGRMKMVISMDRLILVFLFLQVMAGNRVAMVTITPKTQLKPVRLFRAICM